MPSEFSSGKEIDGFRILGVVGRGGMGIVYKAEDISLSRAVALKMIDPSLAGNESFLRRFRAEARALARIDSPHIVGVHALRQTDSGLFIVMEFVEGGTLADLIERGPVDWREAIPIIKQMLQAFEHAHSVGVIHRDIKPRNIMLTPDHTVKVTDFGLAKVRKAGVETTVTQGIAGTLYYMSPEQARGLEDLDHRSDLYSLGMTVYEMLAGKVPFDKQSGEYAVLKAIVEQPLPPPEKFVPKIPKALSQIVMKSLEKDPGRRFQHAQEMLEAVEVLDRGGSRGAKVSPTKPKKIRSSNTTPWWSVASLRYGVIGVLAVLLVLVAGYFVISAGSAGPVESEGGTMSLITQPSGATVYLNDKPVGETPLDGIELPGEVVSLRVAKDGYRSIDTTFFAERGEPLSMNLQLATVNFAPQTASILITSVPAGADIWIDNVLVGKTPFSADTIQAGVISVDVKKNGYRPWSRAMMPVESGQDYTLQATLQSTTPPRSLNGTLDLSAEPAGTALTVDGRAMNASGTRKISAGPHHLTCGDTPFQADTTVTVRAGTTQRVVCYAESTVNITTAVSSGPAPWASVWINGENAGQSPRSMKMRPGRYQVSLRREGFNILDPEKTIEIRPVFAKKIYRLVFRIQKQ